MSLYCASCDAPHDLDMGPDDGTCMICGGPLIEDDTERELIGAGGKAIVDAVSDGLLTANVIRGKVGSGEN